ncbi:DUF5681 domain-containing protein [Caballeronia mineralivorans]|uniref:DUF5681 domain-containing protein n=1 Tax=Caballeronia mineralivorans TaxID=2010198 RepID=UPI0007C7D056|nr:DUF5681 domain-containing protein [Caballeronia mineralivorans]
MAALPTQYKPGQTGNKRGRPPGAKNRSTEIARALADQGSAIAKVVVDAALAGDMQAATLVMSRLYPALKARSQVVQFDLDTTLPLVEQARQVLQSVANGVLDADTGKQLIDTINSFGKLREIDEMSARVMELERFLFDTVTAGHQGMERITIEQDTKS